MVLFITHILFVVKSHNQRNTTGLVATPLIDLQAFIALLCGRGVYGGMNVYSEMSWDKEWGISFFSTDHVQKPFSRNS